MKHRIIILVTVFILSVGFATPVYAITDEQAVAIQSFLDEARRISRAPGIAIAVVVDGETHLFFSGVINREAGAVPNEDTLWGLASVSKPFTALGILLLEEQSYLSLTDSVMEHLPWLTLRYRGQPLDKQDLRLYHLIHHTSGFFSRNSHAEQGERDTLQNAVASLINAELGFFPGERYGYGNENFNILGLIIESVSGQSYDVFMREQIFEPLGLAQTSANRDEVEATGRLAEGHLSVFIFATIRRDVLPGVRGNVPTGGIVSSIGDLARWMEIQLGLIDDFPEIFQTVIPRSHEPDQSVASRGWGYTAAAWEINIDGTAIWHMGFSREISSHIQMFPLEQIGIAILVNAYGVNVDGMAHSIKDILDGNLMQTYAMYFIQILDIAFTILTVVGGLLTILFVFFGLRRIKRKQKHPISKKRVALIAVWFAITLPCVYLFMHFPS